MAKPSSNSADDALFQAGLDLSTLGNLFECVRHHAQTMIEDSNPDTEHAALILECIAEKGVAETAAALKRLHKATVKAAAGASHG